MRLFLAVVESQKQDFLSLVRAPHGDILGTVFAHELRIGRAQIPKRRSRQNTRGAVVLRKHIDFRVEIFYKIVQHVFGARATPLVDGLEKIPAHHHVVLAENALQHRVFEHARILHFVHDDILVTGRPPREGFGLVQITAGENNQVVVIHAIALFEVVVVGGSEPPGIAVHGDFKLVISYLPPSFIGNREHRGVRFGLGATQIFIGVLVVLFLVFGVEFPRLARVFERANKVAHGRLFLENRKLRIVLAFPFHVGEHALFPVLVLRGKNAANELLGVRLVAHGGVEVLVPAPTVFLSHQSKAKAVNRANFHAACLSPYVARNILAHLLASLRREGETENLARLGAFGTKNMAHAVGDGKGLARACAGE